MAQGAVGQPRRLLRDGQPGGPGHEGDRGRGDPVHVVDRLAGPWPGVHPLLRGQGRGGRADQGHCGGVRPLQHPLQQCGAGSCRHPAVGRPRRRGTDGQVAL